MQMTFLTAVDVSQLFHVNKHILKFNEALDKLEQIYASLKSNGDAPDNKTYLSAINTTLKEYYHIASIYVIVVEAYNQANSLNQQRVNNSELIDRLRKEFANWQAQNKQSQSRGSSEQSKNLYIYRSEHYNLFFMARCK